MNLNPIVSGASAYVYIAYASDASGTGFTQTDNASLHYIAFKNVQNNPIVAPQASDFTGLWHYRRGATGDTGAAGSNGTNGTNGTNGADGNTVLYGTAAPTTEGVNGDFYIRTTTNYIYGPKAAGVWPSGTSLVGPTGATGDTGATGATGSTGATGPAAAGFLSLTAAGMYPTTTGGCAEAALFESTTNDVCNYVLDFSPTAIEYASGEAVFPPDWNGGTITATFFWMANDTTTNAVVWGIAGISFGDGDTFDTAFGTAQEVTDANASTANQVRKSAATSAITLAGTPAAGEKVVIRVYRKGTDAADTLAVDARLLDVMLTFTRS